MESLKNPLRSYLDEYWKGTQEEFAAKVGAVRGAPVCRDQVCKWANGRTCPSLATKVAIQTATGGVVSISSWPPANHQPKRSAKMAVSDTLDVVSSAGRLSHTVAVASEDGVIDEDEAEAIKRDAAGIVRAAGCVIVSVSAEPSSSEV